MASSNRKVGDGNLESAVWQYVEQINNNTSAICRCIENGIRCVKTFNPSSTNPKGYPVYRYTRIFDHLKKHGLEHIEGCYYVDCYCYWLFVCYWLLCNYYWNYDDKMSTVRIWHMLCQNIKVETEAQLVRLAKYGSKIRVGFTFPICFTLFTFCA